MDKTMDKVETRVTQLANSTIRRAPMLGRKITRRLSLVTRVPSLLVNRNYQVTGSRESIRIRPPRPRKVRSFHVTVMLPDDSQRTLIGDTKQTVRDLISHVLLEYRVEEPVLRLGDSLAEADPEAEAALLEGDTLIVEEGRVQHGARAEGDARYRLTESLLAGERRYLTSVRAVEQIYGTPLRKLSSISVEEHRQLFTGIQPVCSVSAMLVNKLECALAAWDENETRVGGLFSKQLLTQYEDYKEFYSRARELLREKQTTDEEFVEFCKLRRGAAKHTLDTLLCLPVQRLAQYERYFQDLLSETPPDHPDVDDLTRVRGKVKQLVSSPGGDISELDRIQDLFPSDSLGLHGKDPSYPRMKSLMRKRSAPATRLQRALSAKSLRPTSSERSAEDGGGGGDAMPLPANDTTDGPPVKRQFVMETPVQFTMGLQSQERHLFLFTDMLLVAKARSGGNFKLKDKVRLSEMWLAGCLDEVTEVTKDPATSFVMGWPTANVVATFSCPSTRDLWYNKLHQMITDERQHEAKATTIQVVYYDQVNNIDFCKTLSVGSSLPARDCVRYALTNLEMSGASPTDYRLWVRTGLEDAPYPLIGHELPFAIKMNFVREYVSEDGAEMDHCNNIYNTDPSLKCQFILRHARKSCLTPSPDAAKKKKALKKSPIRIHKVFRRTNSKSDSIDSAVSTCSTGLLFGQPLSRLCENELLPKPIMDILVQLFMKGPFTVGIFRKSANARVVKEMREKLDSEVEVNMESVNIYVLAALLKEFVRSLPDALLGSDLYDEWRTVPEIDDEQEKVNRVRTLCDRLPAAHVTLLGHLLCVLHFIARRSLHNLMSAANVAVCVGPSLLAPANPAQVLTSDNAKLLPSVVEFLIEHCAAIFGADVLTLFGPPPEREVRTDSGAEESDSLHSSGGVRRDDSSIDSLERELLGENEPLPRKDKMSVTNLSRDSGLTLSDTQLYAPDDEEAGSTSSGHSGQKSVNSVYSSGRGSDAGYRHYPAPSNPSAIYAAVCRRQLAPSQSSPAAGYGRPHSPAEGVYARPPARHTNTNFKRQDWTRQHHPLRRAGRQLGEGRAPMRRSASEESLLNSYGNLGRNSPAARRTSPPPAPTRASLSPPMVRSKSAHHIVERRETGPAPVAAHDPPTAGDWKRSRSTPHIDEVDRSYDSSTLSDDDSTPHVSRSNSRSKDCALVNDLWERTYGTLDSRSDSGSHASRHSSFKSSRTGSFSTVRSTGTVRSQETGTPPSYDLAVSRRQWYQKSPGAAAAAAAAAVAATPPRPTGLGVPEQLIREQTILSSRAKQLYEESLRIYAQQTAGPDMVHASPVCAVPTDDAPPAPPPLPPKTEAPPLPPKQKTPLKRLNGSGASGSRLKQLPPVHVNVSESPARRGADQPPALPPKERTVIQIGVDPPTPARPQRPKRKVSKREVETQTEPDGAAEEAWSPPHVTLVEIDAPGAAVPAPVGPSERRGRNRRRDRLAMRSRSQGDLDQELEPETELEWAEEPPAELRSEINWSVSRLRAMFSDSVPPPYRHPPLHRAGAGDVYAAVPAPRPASSGHKRSDSTCSSNYGEESYV